MTRHDHQSHSASPTLEDPNDPKSRLLAGRRPCEPTRHGT